jgi:hypothetical protein
MVIILGPFVAIAGAGAKDLRAGGVPYLVAKVSDITFVMVNATMAAPVTCRYAGMSHANAIGLSGSMPFTIFPP